MSELTIKFIKDYHGTKAGAVYSTSIPQNKRGAMDRVRSGDAVIVSGTEEEKAQQKQAEAVGLFPDMEPPRKRGRPPKKRPEESK